MSIRISRIVFARGEESIALVSDGAHLIERCGLDIRRIACAVSQHSARMLEEARLRQSSGWFVDEVHLSGKVGRADRSLFNGVAEAKTIVVDASRFDLRWLKSTSVNTLKLGAPCDRASFDFLSELINIEHMSIVGEDAEAFLLCYTNRLKSVEIVEINNFDVAQLGDSDISHLELSGDDLDLSGLSRFSNLTRLTIRSPRVPAGLSEIGGLRSLRDLLLDGLPLKDLDWLGLVHPLERLELRGIWDGTLELRAPSLAPLSKIEHIQKLVLSGGEWDVSTLDLTRIGEVVFEGDGESSDTESSVSVHPLRTFWRPLTIPGDPGPGRSNVAGTPYLSEAEAWPECPHCSCRLRFELQIELADVPNANETGLLQLFTCDCPESDRDADYVFARIVDGVRRPTSGLVPSPFQLRRPAEIVGWDFVNESSVETFETDVEVRGEAVLFPEDGGQVCDVTDKLFGRPDWIHEPEVPLSPVTGKPMVHLLQLVSEQLVDRMWGDRGRAYLFYCPTSRLVKFVTQSH